MKFTLSWLKDHLETNATLEEILEALTDAGLEVEGVEDYAEKFAPFRVAYVKSAEKHPDADKLQVCTVETAEGDMQVVCGAPNARAGMKGVFAPVGSDIPGTDITLKKSKIRGVESCGMLVSEREMGLSDEHTGIIELPGDTEVGKPFAEVMGLDDPVIEIAVTPNRADCAGVRGIARDLAAAGLGTLKAIGDNAVPGDFKSSIKVSFDLPGDKANACDYFIGRYIRNVKNGPSPAWLQQRLRAVGLRPISALVDITNYMTLDLNRPLHVFDADSVAGNLTVRLSKKGEKLDALDGKEYELDNDMTVIADDDGVLALGGVIGGDPSGCTEETANVYVECALFDTVRTARTGRKLAIDSDARYRFERGIDPAFLGRGMEVATRLIMDLCGGEPSEVVVTGGEPEWRRQISFHPDRVGHLGGVDIPLEEQSRILMALGFEIDESGEGRFNVTPPSWRADVEGEADLVEEILRIYGYDNIPVVSLPREGVTRPAVNENQRRAMRVRRALAQRGLDESMTWSFIPSKYADLFGINRNQAREQLRLVNPISSDMDMMRPSVLPGLIEAAGRNAARGYPDSSLFEMGACFHDATPEGQMIVAGGVRSGDAVSRHWSEEQRGADVFDAKADALAVLENCGMNPDSVQVKAEDLPDWFHPGRSGALCLGPNVLAHFGEIHPVVLEEMDVKGPVAAFEVYLNNVPLPRKKATANRPALDISALQPLTRDFAFIVDQDVAAENVVRAARGADKKLIVAAEIFDVYVGKGVEDGKKSLALSVTLQPRDQTLTDSDIEAVSNSIVASVTKQTGGVLRA